MATSQGGKKQAPKTVKVDEGQPDREGFYLREKTYFFRRRVKGVNIYKPLGRDYTNAAKAIEDLNIEIKKAPKRVAAEVVAEKEKQKWTVEALLNDFATTHTNNEYGTVRLYRNTRETFLYWCNKNNLTHISDITASHIINFYNDRRAAPIIQKNDQRKYTREFCVNGASEWTLKREIDYIKRIFEYAKSQHDIIKDNPVVKSKIKIEVPKNTNVEKRSFNRNEVKRMLVAAVEVGKGIKSFGNFTWQDMLKFYFLSGLRKEELLNLQWSDIKDDAEQGFSYFEIKEKTIIEQKIVSNAKAINIITDIINSKQKQDMLFCDEDLTDKFLKLLPVRSKQELLLLKVCDVDNFNNILILNFNKRWKPKGKDGIVPITKNLEIILNTISRGIEKCGYVFQHKNGGKVRTHILPIFHKTLEKSKILKYTDKFGIEREVGDRKLTLHATRHTTAVLLREKGIALGTIMEILRHGDIAQTLNYAKAFKKEAKLALETLDF